MIEALGRSRWFMLMPWLLAVAVSLCLPILFNLVGSTDPLLHLTVRLTNLADAVSQPATGFWNPVNNNVEITNGEASTLLFQVFCGPVAAVSFPTRVGILYECQASDDGMKSWMGSQMRVVGTGTPVTLYDSPYRPKRSYRVKESNL